MPRRPWLALLPALAALAVAAPGLAAADVSVEFTAPAQAEGDAEATGAQWAILVFRDSGGTRFDVDLEAGGTATNHTALKARSSLSNPSPEGVASPGQALPDAVQGQLSISPGSWASLYVEALGIEVSAAPLRGTLGRAEPGMNSDKALPQGLHPDTAYRGTAHEVADRGSWFGFQGQAGAGVPFTLRAVGLQRLEWHNATLDCRGAGACPAGSPPQEVQLGAAQASLAVLTYTELQVPGGSIEGSGEAFIGAFGGPAVDLALTGTLRLPQATVRGDCQGQPCPDPAGRTFLGDGHLSLAGISPHPSAPQRLQAGMSGTFGARFDESPEPAFGGAAGALAGAAALVAIPFVAKAAAAFFARSARPPPLKHPKRQALYDLVCAEPGLPFREIQRRLGWPNGTLSHHMERLLDAHLVVRRGYRNTVRYFENHGRHDATWEETVLLRDPGLRSLHDWLRSHPSSSQREVVAHFKERLGWGRSTTQDRLAALMERRLVQRVRQGRRALYRVEPAEQAPQRAG